MGAVAAILLAGVAAWYLVLRGDDRLPTAASSSFYAAPARFPGPPGTVIRSQPVTDGVPAGARAWKVLYVSRAFDSALPIAVSAVVFAPVGGDPPRGGRPVVAWAHPTTGIASSCAPSLRPGAGASTIPGLQSFLQDGYVVVATDYPGLGTRGPHPYLVGASEGRAVLDGVRATGRLEGAGAGRRFIVWGHSQGGQAALFTGQLARSYAPELHLAGVAAAAPAAMLTELLTFDLPTLVGKVLGSMALESWSKVYRGVDLGQVVSPAATPLVRDVGRHCLNIKSSALGALPAAEALKLTRSVGVRRLLALPAWTRILGRNTPTAGAAAAAPLLITQGTADPIVRPPTTAAFVASLCRRGLDVEFQTLKGVGHNAAGFDSAPAVVLWAQDRFDGVPAPSTCPEQ